MVDRLEQQERYSADLTCDSKARSSQAKGPYCPKQVPATLGAQPHSKVKELPAQPVREHQQDNMLHQHQHNMLQDEVVNAVPLQQQHQHQQQLQVKQHNIPHNPVMPKHNLPLTWQLIV